MRAGDDCPVGTGLEAATGGVHPAIRLASTADMAAHVRAHFGVARFDAWLAGAQPNARQLYGCGLNVATGCAPGVAARMRALADAGLVVLFAVRRVRADGDRAHPFDFLAVRTGKPVTKGFPVLAVVAASPRRVVVQKLPPRAKFDGGDQ